MLATIFYATALVLVALLSLMPALYHVPQAVLAAVVVTAITGLIKPSMFVQLWRISRSERPSAPPLSSLPWRRLPAPVLGRAGGVAGQFEPFFVPAPASAHH